MDFQNSLICNLIFVDSPIRTAKHMRYVLPIANHCHGLFTDCSMHSSRVSYLQGLLDSKLGVTVDIENKAIGMIHSCMMGGILCKQSTSNPHGHT